MTSSHDLVGSSAIPAVGLSAPGENPDGARPGGGYPALQVTVTPPKRPVRVTVAWHRPVSRLGTRRTTEAKPT